MGVKHVAVKPTVVRDKLVALKAVNEEVKKAIAIVEVEVDEFRNPIGSVPEIRCSSWSG